MNKELRRSIYYRSKLKNKFNKYPTAENWSRFKKQRNKCVNLRKKAIKIYFKKITASGFVTNKTFWQTVKPFMTNKSGISNSTFMLAVNNSIITNEKKIASILNDLT